MKNLWMIPPAIVAIMVIIHIDNQKLPVLTQAKQDTQSLALEEQQGRIPLPPRIIDLPLPGHAETDKFLVDMTSIKINKDGTRSAKIGSSLYNQSTTTVLLKNVTIDCVNMKVKDHGGVIISDLEDPPIMKTHKSPRNGFFKPESATIDDMSIHVICQLKSVINDGTDTFTPDFTKI